jgi:predicted HTH transcriptional regulator
MFFWGNKYGADLIYQHEIHGPLVTSQNNIRIEFSPLKLVNVPVNVTQKKILNILNKDKEITATKLADLLKITEKTVKRTVKILKEKGMIERIGADKNGYWIVICL